MHRKILFIGNSITQGVDGYSFIRLLQTDFPHWQLENQGWGGDTLVGICDRLLKNVAQHQDYDAVVLEAGHNDLLIPFMQNRSSPFPIIARQLIKRGSLPTPDPIPFANHLQSTMDQLRTVYTGPLIITTLSSLGENLSNHLNTQRQRLNAVIRQCAHRNQLFLADTGAAFDLQLVGKETADLVLANPYTMLLVDRLFSRSRRGVSYLSRRRNTHLTIDGVHLNYEGAIIYRDVLNSCFKRVFSSEKSAAV